MTCHASRLARVSFQQEPQGGFLKRHRNGIGVTDATSHVDASLGRLQKHAGSPSREIPCFRRNGNSGIELAEELVRIVNVQHNFDANAKVVSTIDTMQDSILNLQV